MSNGRCSESSEVKRYGSVEEPEDLIIEGGRRNIQPHSEFFRLTKATFHAAVVVVVVVALMTTALKTHHAYVLASAKPQASSTGSKVVDITSPMPRVDNTDHYSRLREVFGSACPGPEGSNVSRYLAIPYAKPPVGKRRWEAPEPLDHTQLRIDGTGGFAAPCFQFFGNRSNENTSEDCLYLNVFAPNPTITQQSNAILPVLVFFHGGFFLVGDSAEYDACSLVQRSISISSPLLVVTVNYRLGPFGFLYDPVEGDVDAHVGVDGGGKGLYGFLDQVVALEWIRENIARFGANASEITISGQSAGAHSVMLHLASSRSRKLFRRAFAMSPRAEFFMTISEAKKTTKRLKIALGCDYHESMKECVDKRNISALHLAACTQDPNCAQVASGMRGTLGPMLGSINFMPVVGTKLFPSQPIDLIKKSSMDTVEAVMIGSNTYEGALFQSMDSKWWWKRHVKSEDEGSSLLSSWTFSSVAGKLWDKDTVRKATSMYNSTIYREASCNLYQVQAEDSSGRKVEYDITDFQRTTQAYGEYMYTCPCQRAAKALTQSLHAPSIYAYVFAHMPEEFSRSPHRVCWNATHGTNMPFTFNKPGVAFGLKKFTQEEEELALAMSSTAIRFVTAENVDKAMIQVSWPPWNSTRSHQQTKLWTCASGGGPRMISGYSKWKGNPLEGVSSCDVWEPG
ncbi:hypothetical protein AAMO2058_000695300 [Amorphochlora amoebiformis]